MRVILRSLFPVPVFVSAIAIVLAASVGVRAQAEIQFDSVVDDTTGIELIMPFELIQQKRPGNAGSIWQWTGAGLMVETIRTDGQDLRKMFEDLRLAFQQVGREEFESNRFFLGGMINANQTAFYTAQKIGDEIRGVLFYLDVRKANEYGAVYDTMVGNVTLFPGQQNADEQLAANIAPQAATQAPAGFERIEDGSTGVALTLPSQMIPLVREAGDAQWWEWPEKGLSLDTLQFVDQDLAGLHNDLMQNFASVERDEGKNDGFILTGKVPDGRTAHFSFRKIGKETRGVIIYFDPNALGSDTAIINTITTGYDLFPVQRARQPVAAARQSEPTPETQPKPQREANLTQPAPASDGGACRPQAEELRGLTGDVSVTTPASGSVPVKQSIEFKWKRGELPLYSQQPIYLVVTMPDYVRFEGDHIIPIPPGGKVPGDISYGDGKLRVFIILSGLNLPVEGSFKARAYRAGPFEINSAVVALTDCGEVVLSNGPSKSLSVEPGAPELFVQDFFDSQKPESVVNSNDGRYRLERYGANYRVLDNASGVKLVDRAGRDANFSPDARFVASYVEGNTSTGGKMEIVDLVTGEPVPGLNVAGPTLSWAAGDAIMLEGTTFHPELRVRRMLVDPRLTPGEEGTPPQEQIPITASFNGRDAGAWHSFKTELLLSHGIIIIQPYTYIEDYPSKPAEDFLPIAAYDLGTGAEIFSGTSLAGLSGQDGDGDEVLSEAGLYDALIKRFPELGGFPSLFAGWNAGDRPRLSHYSPFIDDTRLPFIEENAAKEGKTIADPIVRQKEYLVPHVNVGADEQHTATRTDRTISNNASDWRTRSVENDITTTVSVDKAFAEQIAQYEVCVTEGCFNPKKAKRLVPESLVKSSDFLQWSGQYGTQVTEFTDVPGVIEETLENEIPASKPMFDADPNQICYTGDPDGAEGTTENIKFRIEPDDANNTDVHGVWTWKLGKRKYWLVQAVCSHAGILGSPVLLFADGPGKSGEVYSLGGGAQTPNFLHRDFQTTQSEDVLRIRPVIVDERWLLIAAPAGRAAGIIDLQKPDKPIYIHNLRDAYATVHLFRTFDGKSLIQLNNDGRFHIYDIAKRSRRISGRWVDDEIVFVTDNGYYNGSYEGAHFVHMRFAGDDNIFALSQFQKQLRNEGIVNGVLSGKKKDGPKLNLAIPPRVDVSIKDEAGKPAALLDLSARAGLKKVRLYEDGQLLAPIEVSGDTTSLTVPFDEGLTGRWLTAQAEDETGILSAPRIVPNPKSSAGDRKLYAVLVGIDDYKEEDLKLRYAKSDAKRLAKALREKRGGYYASVEITESLLGAPATGKAIVSALEDAVKKAKEGDTILFSYAGHGVQHEGEDDDFEKFYLTPSGFNSEEVEETGLPWSKISKIIGGSKARVMIILDACHSGATGSEDEQTSTNDAVISALLKDRKAPVLVLAASKGRQKALEDGPDEAPKWGGGVFTHALVTALTSEWKTTDVNNNDALEVSEIYGAVKRTVVRETNGFQTPWLVRQDLIGDFALF